MKTRLKSKIFSLISILAFHFVLGCSDSISDFAPVAPTAAKDGIIKIALGFEDEKFLGGKNSIETVSSSARSAVPSSFSNSSGDPLVFAAAVTLTATPSNSDLLQATLVASNLLEIPFKPSATARNNYYLNIYAYPNGTTTFTTASALLYGSARISIGANETVVTLASPVKMFKTETATEKGFVDLKIKIPAGYTLSCSDTTNFYCTGSGTDYTFKSYTQGVTSGSYKITFSILKDSNTVYAWTETIHIYPALTTNRWNTGEVADATTRNTRLITAIRMSSTFYVRGTGSTWFDGFDSADGDDSTGNGSLAKPYATIQKAVERIKAINNGSTEYKIYVDGKIMATAANTPIADFSEINNGCSIALKGLDATVKATLDGNGNAPGIVVGSITDNGSTKTYTNLNLTLENLNIQNCYAAFGAAILLMSKEDTNEHKITNCIIQNNKATKGNDYAVDGGAIYNVSKTLTITGCTITENQVDSCGGAIGHKGGTLNIDGCTISNNKTINGKGGGAIYNDMATMNITDTVFSGNKTTATDAGQNSGGAINNYAGTITIDGCTFTSNVANNTSSSLGGGAIFNTLSNDGSQEGKITIINCTFGGNTAKNGNAIYNNSILKMSGTFDFDETDTIYLPADKFITITGNLTGAAPVATITPESYTAGTVVLKATTADLISANYKKFAISDASTYSICPDITTPTQAILAKPQITSFITIAGDYRYKFTLLKNGSDFSGTSLNANDELKFKVQASYKDGAFADCTGSSYTLAIRQGGENVPISGTASTNENLSNVSLTVPAILATLGGTYQIYMAITIDGETYDYTVHSLTIAP